MRTIITLIIGAALLTACTGVRLTQGDKAFDRMAYAKAAERYDRVFAAERTADELNTLRPWILRAAETHSRERELADAGRYYELAASMGPLEADQALRFGQALMAMNDLDAAAEQFAAVLATEPENRAAQDLLASCQGRDGFYADTLRYAVSELPMSDVASAFCAVPYKDGIVIAADQPAGLDKSNPWNGRGFLDLYFVRKHTAVTWDAPEALPGDVNGPYHEGPAVFSADGRTMFFTRSNYVKFKLAKDAGDVSHLKLFRATLDDQGRWGDLHAFGHNGEEFSTGHAALSADGHTIYFASDRPGGIGGSDLWRSVDHGDGFGAPENLGPTINTPGDELFPTIAGDALYFSSNAHHNMGGLDLFVTNPTANGWAEPRNLGYPVNTRFDDFALTLNPDAKSGYLSSDRTGIDRVFQFFIQEPVFWVEGDVFGDPDNMFLPNSEVSLTNLLTHEDSAMITGDDGHFRFRMEPGATYRLQVAHEGRITQTREISTAGMTSGKTFKEDFHLQRAQVDMTFALNIYFDYDRWDIRPDASAELDKVVLLMQANPQLSFELSAHTDSRGGYMYNLVLSDARAHSAEDYLIRAGVDPRHITSKGYGEERLVNDCGDGINCTEEEHQANRRVELRITSIKELAEQHR